MTAVLRRGDRDRERALVRFAAARAGETGGADELLWLFGRWTPTLDDGTEQAS